MIPIHSLPEEQEIKKLTAVNSHSIYRKNSHRDSHYQFVILEKGSCVVAVDFKTIPLKAGQVLCILPGQVHRALSARQCHAWIFSVRREWVHENYQFVFNSAVPFTGAIRLHKQKAAALSHSISLLYEFYTSRKHFHFSSQLLHATTDLCTGICADAYSEHGPARQQPGSRPAQLLHQFRQLLSQHYITMKSPADYAARLHISLSYLNEVVKEQTGIPLSRHIQDQVITEARRILYYTDISIKELAYKLGYDDYSYFCRLFKQISGMTPAQARKSSRE
ncbi:AraC-like DNA-binding protein [Chitinophaga polysaccharea]|uniref:AraC-like DNA-binding protein n=1 Tax=Chitinophaga polysaccharea TaxID=1293035 RepID=A0A561P9X3_9BACT|nr:AraC family transcriptional regulator [Chitinophaga polysaccharea]TWF34917.1 AraC-like DNA-binding protein [Chitinophaga polysaccharea]